jgi:hypothetical protein
MKFKLTDILNSTILLEGRLEDIKAKYEGNDDVIDTLSQGDPSDNNKYLGWMAKQYFNQNYQDSDLIIDVVGKFNISGDRLKKQGFPSDINQYKTLSDLETAFSKLSRRDTPSKKELKGYGELVYDGPKVYIIAPRNWEGSCKFGTGAQWCVSMTDKDNYWKQYSAHSLFYFVISKTLPSSDNSYKIAIQKRMDTGENIYWNVPDNSSRTPQNPDITPEILDIVEKHSIEAKKHILKKLVEDMVSGVSSTLTYENIMKTKELLTDGQLFKIIMNDITVLNGGGNNGNIFSYIVERLNTENTIKLLKTSYDDFAKLLGNDKILTWVDENTERTEKLELASSLKGHLKTVSPNIRSKIQKWGMTDEAWVAYETTSQYVYLGDKETQRPIGEIYVVDKFDPSSYEVISQLRLKMKHKDVSLYGVNSKKDELSEYLDGNVPDEVMSNIKITRIPEPTSR